MPSTIGVTIYKPTSLDFINRPNPVEPQSAPQKHPLNGTPQLPKASKDDLLRLFYEASCGPVGRPAKRRKSGVGKTLDLPELPVRQSAKRLRIPPTLSGLHQPPPDAGLLPSISTEQPVPLREKAQAQGSAALGDETAERDAEDAAAKTPEANYPKPKRNKWSDEETACLLKGVARLGIGNWSKILSCPDYHFKRRTALDLKDRFRVCCPNDYKRTNKADSASTGMGSPDAERDIQAPRPSRSNRKTDTKLQELGINQPFQKSSRRKRHGYSAVEDEALLRGFKQYGTQWAKIRSDEELDLNHRTATDLRDRMRTRYPDEYANAGLAPRPESFPKPAKRGTDAEASGLPQQPAPYKSERHPKQKGPEDPAKQPLKLKEVEKPDCSLRFPRDDVFFALPYNDDEDAEGEPITLDRGILDWAYEASKVTMLDTSKPNSIDPITTLNLPRPAPVWPASSQQQSGGSSSLPSVATIATYNDFGAADQLELPSLVLGPLESDGRASGHFLGFDELLS